ncbi:MAG: Holliday junction branch migration DNA helicase RuvB [Armatimonadetes bacterium]|nr:Holliday junction branch migration DNA helicase RuvB [Armatimonadota bacterium]
MSHVPSSLPSARPVSPERQAEDEKEATLRPQTLSEYVGQTEVVANLKVFLQAARQRGEPVDHVLLSGPPGLGKTTLASLVAREMGAELRTTSGPAIERPIDLLVLLNSLKQHDVLFIDEIHRMSRVVEEILYPVMEDLSFDRILSKGVRRGAVKHKIAPFTLVGATTRGGALSAPLRSRFGILFHLDYYSSEELERIVSRSAGILAISAEAEGAFEIAGRCRGTPRIANRLLRRVRDYAQVEGATTIDREVARRALDRMGIDRCGLDRLDQRILDGLIHKFDGRPVGLSTLAAAVQEDPQNLEEMYEPFLLAAGFLQKTPRGRQATPRAYRHLGLTPPACL